MPARRADASPRACGWAPRSSTRSRARCTTAGLSTAVGDEGGFAPGPRRPTRRRCEMLVRGIEAAGYRPGDDVAIALDPATSEVFADGAYVLEHEGRTLSAAELADYWADLAGPLPDRLDRGRHGRGGLGRLEARSPSAWATASSSSATTSSSRTSSACSAASSSGVGNSILVKVNQIGTLTETLAAIRMAREAGYTAVMSHRSGETEDVTIADLAVATGCGQIKTGAPVALGPRGEVQPAPAHRGAARRRRDVPRPVGLPRRLSGPPGARSAARTSACRRGARQESPRGGEGARDGLRALRHARAQPSRRSGRVATPRRRGARGRGHGRRPRRRGRDPLGPHRPRGAARRALRRSSSCTSGPRARTSPPSARPGSGAPTSRGSSGSTSACWPAGPPCAVPRRSSARPGAWAWSGPASARSSSSTCRGTAPSSAPAAPSRTLRAMALSRPRSSSGSRAPAPPRRDARRRARGARARRRARSWTSCAAASACPSPSTSSSSSTTRGRAGRSTSPTRSPRSAPWAWDARTVADAAFARYLRGPRLRRRPPRRVADRTDASARVARAGVPAAARAAWTWPTAGSRACVELLGPVVVVGEDGARARAPSASAASTARLTVARARPRPRSAGTVPTFSTWAARAVASRASRCTRRGPPRRRRRSAWASPPRARAGTRRPPRPRRARRARRAARARRASSRPRPGAAWRRRPRGPAPARARGRAARAAP